MHIVFVYVFLPDGSSSVNILSKMKLLFPSWSFGSLWSVLGVCVVSREFALWFWEFAQRFGSLRIVVLEFVKWTLRVSEVGSGSVGRNGPPYIFKCSFYDEARPPTHANISLTRHAWKQYWCFFCINVQKTYYAVLNKIAAYRNVQTAYRVSSAQRHNIIQDFPTGKWTYTKRNSWIIRTSHMLYVYVEQKFEMQQLESDFQDKANEERLTT